ncbi:aryl-sulfate sulfotransferase [Pontiella sp.]|uniref:aryl-sulfate sulfotransferase n=1 Tax=Pontiella sp. TaxID=2837462 RepID=UPI003562E73A
MFKDLICCSLVAIAVGASAGESPENRRSPRKAVREVRGQGVDGNVSQADAGSTGRKRIIRNADSDSDWYVEAERLLKEAAASENPPPFINRRVAMALLNNPEKLDEAEEWIRKAESEGDPEVPLLRQKLAAAREAAKPAPTGVVVKTDDVFPGYTLLAPKGFGRTYLLNNDGEAVHEWVHTNMVTVTSSYLLPNGNLLRMALDAESQVAGQRPGIMVQELSWDGDVVWQYLPDLPGVRIHHDMLRLPNGNMLVVVSEKKELQECLAVGRDFETLPKEMLWVDAVYEVKSVGRNGGEVVWRWSPWDHLIQDRDPNLPSHGNPADFPERIDIKRVRAGHVTDDWLHVNSVAYNKDRNEVMLSVHALGEVWVVSRKSGKLVYRWGNPAAYGRSDLEDQTLFQHHNAHWIEDGLPGSGNILVFNNGVGRPGGDYSSVLELKPPLGFWGGWKKDGSAFKPCPMEWEYEADPPDAMFSEVVSGAQRLPNGNTLICIGIGGMLLEVDAQKQIVWKYVNPVQVERRGAKGRGKWKASPGTANMLYRAQKYPLDYPAFKDRNLNPNGLLGQMGLAIE